MKLTSEEFAAIGLLQRLLSRHGSFHEIQFDNHAESVEIGKENFMDTFSPDDVEVFDKFGASGKEYRRVYAEVFGMTVTQLLSVDDYKKWIEEWEAKAYESET